MIPPAVPVSPPVNAPMSPRSSTAFLTPSAREYEIECRIGSISARGVGAGKRDAKIESMIKLAEILDKEKSDKKASGAEAKRNRKIKKSPDKKVAEKHRISPKNAEKKPHGVKAALQKAKLSNVPKNARRGK